MHTNTNNHGTRPGVVRVLGGILLAVLLLAAGTANPAAADEAYTLTTAVAGEGTITINPNMGWYPAGTTVYLSITPAEGWIFLRWNGFRVWPGGVSDSYEPNINFIMDANKSITAYLYRYDDEIITIPDPGLESAILQKMGRPPGYQIRRSELATVTHLNAQERGITDLTGLEYCTNLEILNLYSNSITDISPIENCTRLTGLHLEDNLIEDITPLINNPGLDTGTWITLSYNRLDLGPGPDMDNIQTLLDRGVSLDYTPQQVEPTPATFTLTTSYTGQGAITKSPEQAAYESGTSILITAAPDTRWTFEGWSGDITGVDNPLTLVITQDTTLVATFTQIVQSQYQLTVSVNGNGRVTLDPPGGAYPAGTVVRLTAVPSSGSIFNGWSGDAAGAENPLSVNITGAMAITASFLGTAPPAPVINVGIPISSGGGGGTSTKRFTPVSESCTSDGTLWEEVTVLSVDEDLKIIIPEGTQILNANGYPLRTITVTTITEPDNCPDEACFIGNAYDIGPRGITFDNPVYLTMSYDADEIPENGTEGRLRIACRNEGSETWEYLEGEVDTEASAITAVLHHFSQYAVILPTHPARFVASPLMVTPAAADRDTIITAGTTITNTGDLTGSYTLVCLLDGKLLKQENMRLRGGESRDIEVTFRAGKTGMHRLDFNGVRSSYEVLPVPASFQLSGLVVSPGSVAAGESVSVSVTVTNSGEAGGDYYIECSIDGTAAGSRSVHVDGLSSDETAFTIAPTCAGTYDIDINEVLFGRFTVEEAEVVPQDDTQNTQPVIAPTAPETAAAPDTAPAQPASAAGWWVAGGAVFLILFSGAIVVLKRRNGRNL